MTLVITHPYVSSITETTPSGGPGGNVGPSEWNANHTLTGLVSPAQGGTGITSGTGVTYFSSGTVIADSGTLTANALVVGGGANGAPATLASLGTTSTLLHGNASGNPSFGAVNLGSEVAGQLPVANGGTSLSSGQGVLYFSGASAISGSGTLTANSIIAGGGANGAPATSNILTLATTDTIISRIAAGTLSVSQSTAASSPATLQVYNVIDSFTSPPTNYERGVLDWITNSNVLTIGTQKGGTGATRNIEFVVGGANQLDYGVTTAGVWSISKASGTAELDFYAGGSFSGSIFAGSGLAFTGATGGAMGAINNWGGGIGQFRVGNNGGFSWDSSGNPSNNTIDTGLGRAAGNVVVISSNGQAGGTLGWLNLGGQARVTSNVTSTTTSFADITGMKVTLQASRSYSFRAEIIATCSSSGGIQVAASSTTTSAIPTIQLDGYAIDTALPRGYSQQTTLNSAIIGTTITGTALHAHIYGTVTTTTTGASFKLQVAQQNLSATQTIVLAGSYMFINDTP